MGRTEGLYGQGGCIYIARLQPWLKSASLVLNLDFNPVLRIRLLVSLEGEFVCHWSVTMKHLHVQVSVSFISNFVLHFTKSLSLYRIYI